MARPPSAASILRNTKRAERVVETHADIASDMILPNDSQVRGADDKVKIKGFTDGSVLFSEDQKIFEDNSNFFWDNVNKRLGIGTAAPGELLHVSAAGKAAIKAEDITNGVTVVFEANDESNFLGTTSNDSFSIRSNNRNRIFVGTSSLILNSNKDNYDTSIRGDNDTFLLFADASTDRIGIGTATPGYKLDVLGTGTNTARFRSSNNVARLWIHRDTNLGIGSEMANIAFMGDVSGSATIFGEVECSVGSATTQGEICFNTRQDGVVTEQVKIDEDGNLDTKKSRLSEIGGFCIKLTNKSGANSVAGELVNASTGTENAVEQTAIDDLIPMGCFLDSGIADGSEAWIVVGGIAEVLLDDTVAAAIGDWMKVSSNDAGRAESSGTEAPGINHFREIGHCLENGNAGELVKIAMHFN